MRALQPLRAGTGKYQQGKLLWVHGEVKKSGTGEPVKW
jgi:hypothetical protein